MACQHHLWAAHTIERRRAWHASIAFGKHTRSKDVERGMTSPPLDSAHGRTTSGATCHHRLWKAHTVERCRAWHAIITFGQHKQSDDIECVMQSPPLESTQGRMTSGVACHRRPWTAPTVGRRGACHEITALELHRGRSWHDITAIGQNTIGRRRAWHDITALGQHTRSDYVRHVITSPPLGNTHGWTMSGVA